MPGIKETILLYASEIKDEVIEIRRYLHKYPELSYQETQTSSFICNWLRDNGIEFRKAIFGTGVIATIRGRAEGKKVVAVRAEMDALPINENNDFEFVSQNPGKMHACGHDAHMVPAMRYILQSEVREGMQLYQV